MSLVNRGEVTRPVLEGLWIVQLAREVDCAHVVRMTDTVTPMTMSMEMDVVALKGLVVDIAMMIASSK